MTQEHQNIQMTLATQAVESLNVLNKSRSLEIWEKVLKSQEEIDNTARTQKNQAYPEVLSASLIVIAMIFSTIIAKNTDFLSSLTQISHQTTNVWSKRQEGNITTHSHKSKVADVARDRIAQTEQTTDRTISDVCEQVGRLNQKDI